MQYYENISTETRFRDFTLSAVQKFRSYGWKRLYLALRDPVVLTFGENQRGRLGRRTVKAFLDSPQLNRMYIPPEEMVKCCQGVPAQVEAMQGKGVCQV